jgi:vitamin B12 transporter
LIILTDQPPVPPDTVVVTGRGLEEARGDAVYDIVTIDRDRLALSPSNRLEDVLRDVPGFQLFRRSDARSANPTSQGATLRALGGNAASRALLLLDGVPQTDPFGGWVSWPAFDPRRLGATRVLRGGGSGAAGPGALAGTIELASAGPDAARGIQASAAFGSRDAVDLFASLGQPVGGGFLTVSGSFARGDGFAPVVAEQRGPADRAAPYEQASLAVRAVAPFAAGAELQASTLLFRDRRDRGTDFSAIRTDGADAALRLVGAGRWGWSALAYVQSRSFYNSFAAVDAAHRRKPHVGAI